MADLTGLQASQSVKIAGADSSGVEDNYTNASVNGDLFARDVINTSGQNRAQSVTTTAAEALGAAAILTTRKLLLLLMLELQKVHNGYYWTIYIKYSSSFIYSI